MKLYRLFSLDKKFNNKLVSEKHYKVLKKHGLISLGIEQMPCILCSKPHAINHTDVFGYRGLLCLDCLAVFGDNQSALLYVLEYVDSKYGG